MWPFRFGIRATEASSREEWVTLARRAEAYGYDTFVMPDHIIRQFSPVPALMAVADATTRLRVGTMVFANDYRHPLLLAMEAATLDVLSGGRLELGIGAGWRVQDYAQLGIPYDRPGVRVERMREAVRIIKRLLTSEDALDFTGKHYHLKRARVWPRPLQRPHPPIVIGAGGPRMLAIAAREGDIVSLTPQVDARGRHRATEITRAATAAKVARIRAAAGPRFADLEISVWVVDADVGSVPALAKRLPFRLLDTPYFLAGTAGQIASDLRRHREGLGISYWTVPTHALEPFAPVVAELAGR